MHPEHFRCDSVHSFDVGRWNCRRAMWICHRIYMLLCRKLIISQHSNDIVQSLSRTCWLSMHFCVCTLRSAWMHMFRISDMEHAFSMVNNEMELLNLQTSFRHGNSKLLFAINLAGNSGKLSIVHSQSSHLKPTETRMNQLNFPLSQLSPIFSPTDYANGHLDVSNCN